MTIGRTSLWSRWSVVAAGATLAVLSWSGGAFATEYHVAVTGNDAGAGTAGAPFRTIQKAATVMVAGDICTVHAGLYREWVKPARGGTSETSRIVYRAASGEAVYISGAERVTSWVQEGSVWKAVLPNSTFDTFNPYSVTISGDYLVDGGNKHLGTVYLNGAPYLEKLVEADVTGTTGRWRTVVDASNTTIWANFGAKNPNTENAEISVRRYVFAPTAVSLGYITVEGFHISQAATQWAPPSKPQDGMIMSNYGFKWIIQNNEISDSRAVCVVSGVPTMNAPGGINRVGNHTIRNNIIRRCGQAAIAGDGGLPATVIERNLIEDINPLQDFGGWEGAGIKIHAAIDVVIKNNVIRRVRNGAGGHYGIWLDWQAQGSRVSGNVIYEIDQAVMLMEANHGPNLVDNNIFVGSSLGDVSDNTIYVHNLYSTAALGSGGGDGRTPGWFTPHTSTKIGMAAVMGIDNKYFNNVFFGGGTAGLPQRTGFASDYGVYYGAAKSSWGDAHSLVVAGFAPGLTMTSLANGVTVSFKTDSAPADVAAPLITRAFIGVGSLTNQGIENHDGTPITVDKDILGAARNLTRPIAGPLEAPAGDHTVTLVVGPGAPLPGTGGSGGATGGSGGATGGSGGATGGAGGATGGAGGATGGSGGATGGAGGATGGSGGATGGTAGMDAGAGGSTGGAGGATGQGGADAGLDGGLKADSGSTPDAGKSDTGGGSGGTFGTGGATGGTPGGSGGSGSGGQAGSGTGGEPFVGGPGGSNGGTRRSSGSKGGCSFSSTGGESGGLFLGMAALALFLIRRRR